MTIIRYAHHPTPTPLHPSLPSLAFCLPENGTSKQMALVSQLRPSVLPLQCDGAVCWTGLGL